MTRSLTVYEITVMCLLPHARESNYYCDCSSYVRGKHAFTASSLLYNIKHSVILTKFISHQKLTFHCILCPPVAYIRASW